MFINFRPLSFLFIIIFIFCGQVHASANKRPNIVLLLTDDESWFERSAYGLTTVKSPNFDWIAEQGVLFNNAHSSAPSCAPSRASFMTGRNFWELQQGAYIQAWLPSHFATFPQLLKDNGYYIARTGKGWGPGIYPHNALGPEEIGDVFKEKLLDNPGEGLNAVDYAGNVELMLNRKKPDQPFFFWVGIEEPHGPISSNNYKKLATEYQVTPEQVFIPGTMDDNAELKKLRANYVYEILYSDTEFGRIIKHLKSAGELDNTLIIVTSDNGTSLPVMINGKATPYEAGTRVPFAVMMPKNIPRGRVIDDFITSTDIAPTILELAGIDIPKEMSGKSFLSTLTSKKSGWVDKSRSFAVTGLEWHGELDPLSNSVRTIRTDKFSYIERFNNVDKQGVMLSNKALITPISVELYDLKNDLWQLNNLAGKTSYLKEQKSLADQLHQNGVNTHDPRYTGHMEIFKRTRKFVQDRKKSNYKADPYQ